MPFEEEGQCRCEVSRSFATQPQQGLRLGFAGIWMPPRPHLSDTAAHKGKQGLFSLHSGRWCSLCQRCRNSALGGTRISSLCHSALGPQKWVRASARNCGWRIAGRDACPTRGWVKLFLRPVAADGRRCQSALQGGGCWFIQLYFLPVRFILNFEEGLVSRTVSHLRSTLPPWGAEWLRRARGCCPVPFAPRSGSHGQTGAVFSALRETAFLFLDAS